MSLQEKYQRQVPAGTVLFREGDEGTEMYVLQAGAVRITRYIRGEEQLLAELGPGEFFGEMSILNDKPRSATATVSEDATLLTLGPKTFEAMVRANTEIAVRMIRKLAGRLDEANDRIENLLLQDVNSRVVHSLISAARQSTEADDAVLGVTLEELAGRTGIEQRRVEDVLGRMERSRLLTREAGKIHIGSIQKLEEFLEFLEMRERFGEI
jgi:CRP-like cAMP-binding protein